MIHLRNLEVGEWKLGKIVRLTALDLQQIAKDKRFEFSWSDEIEHQIFALRLYDGFENLGLMSIIDYPFERRIQIHLIELAVEHQGKQKQIWPIAGPLIAHACRLAFSKGYQGFVSLQPKGVLVEHYCDTYSFKPMGKQLYVHRDEAEALIQYYLKGNGMDGWD